MNLMRQFLATLLLLCLVTFTYAQGVDCANAVVLAPGTYTANGPATGGGATNLPAMNASWYSYAPTETGLISINSCNGNGDTRLWVWYGDCATLEQEAENDDFCDLGDGTNYASSVSNVIA